MNKTILPVLLVSLALAFTSCTTQTVVTQKQENAVVVKYMAYVFESEDLDAHFEYRNDNIRLSYSCQKNWGFELENTGPVPIYLNPAKSSFIINRYSYPYEIPYNKFNRYYIPDHSIFTDLNLAPAMTDTIAMKLKGIRKDSIFSRSNSPMVIRNQISYALTEDLTVEHVVDNQMWLAYSKLLTKEDLKDSPLTSKKNVFLVPFLDRGTREITYVEKKLTPGGKLSVVVIIAAMFGILISS